jgi:hypothetical protein
LESGEKKRGGGKWKVGNKYLRKTNGLHFRPMYFNELALKPFKVSLKGHVLAFYLIDETIQKVES